jgi:hypothetical protein
VVVCLGAVSGCSGAPGATEELPIQDVSLLVASAQRTMGIETAAENVLIRDCMAQAGFEFYLPDAGAVDPGVGEGAFILFVNEISEDSAVKSGYGAYVDSPFFGGLTFEQQVSDDAEFAASAQAHNSEYYFSLSPDDQQAYEIAFDGGPDGERVTLEDGMGIPAEGCIADSARDVLGDERFDVYLMFNKVQRLMSQLDLEGDPEYDPAFGSWQACMADGGYEFDSVTDAISAGVALRGDAVQPTALEIDQAVTDARCQAEADLPGATQRAFDRKQREVLDESLDLLLTWHDMEVMILERSSAILGVTYEPAF